MNTRIYLLGIGMAVWMVGCSFADKNQGEPPQGANLPTADTQIAVGSAPQTNEAGNETEMEDIRVDVEPAKPDIQLLAEEMPEGPRAMTEMELGEIEGFINGKVAGGYQNYGYLQSGYEAPEYVDLSLVLYNGAGIPSSGDGITEEEARAYTAAAGPIFTDIVHLTTGQINEFLEETAGITLQDLQVPFEGATYLPEFDAYYMQHGDTNREEFDCVSGTVRNGQYWVRCSSRTGSSHDCVVVLRKHGDSYQFVSNQFIVSEGVVKSTAELNRLASDYGSGPDGEYRSGPDFNSRIFATDQRYFTKDELLKMDPYLLEIARNEIYARHGYQFKSSRLREFFSQFRWYEGKYSADAFSDTLLNQYEQANRDLIQSVEVWDHGLVK